ncbi:hypothetical protein [Streptomyces sp. Je 1-369]|uniref:hypothetical protein n=1 Tax=Streptomyces sp. Je 1-369 TaxID=2966192 RepID=UPI0022858839|nr:hypothetical protein [Streptomyces sp. Je 1-369]WAL95979.1 hypothetical protein NOO62_16665 [Streptomyces sp. Je 1-369]
MPFQAEFQPPEEVAVAESVGGGEVDGVVVADSPVGVRVGEDEPESGDGDRSVRDDSGRDADFVGLGGTAGPAGSLPRPSCTAASAAPPETRHTASAAPAAYVRRRRRAPRADT